MSTHKEVSKKVLLIFCLTTLTCYSPDVANFSQGLNIVEGNLRSYQMDNNNRLFLSIESDDGIIVCVLQNKKEVFVIKQIHKELTRAYRSKGVVIYGERLLNGINEIIEGVDYNVYYIKYYSSSYGKYKIVKVTWKKGPSDRIQEFDMKEFFSFLLDYVKKIL